MLSCRVMFNVLWCVGKIVLNYYDVLKITLLKHPNKKKKQGIAKKKRKSLNFSRVVPSLNSFCK